MIWYVDSVFHTSEKQGEPYPKKEFELCLILAYGVSLFLTPSLHFLPAFDRKNRESYLQTKDPENDKHHGRIFQVSN